MKKMVFYIVLFGFIGYQAYKYFSHNAPCYLNGYDRKVKRINEVLFDNQYVYIPDKDICLDYEDVNLLGVYGELYTCYQRGEQENLSDEVKIFRFGDGFPQFNEYDEKGRLITYTIPKFESEECDTIQPHYTFTDSSTSLWINLGEVRTFTFNENGLTTEMPNQKYEYDAKGRLVCSKECEGSYAEYRYLDNYEAEMYLYHDSTKTDLTKYLHYDHFGFVDSVYVNYKYDYYLEARSYESNYTTYASGRIKDRTVIEKRKRYHGGELENKPKKRYSFNEDGNILLYEDLCDSRRNCYWKYDVNGRLTEFKREDRVCERYYYQFNGRLEKIVHYDRNGDVEYEIIHDKQGNSVKRIRYDNRDIPEETVVASYEYF